MAYPVPLEVARTSSLALRCMTYPFDRRNIGIVLQRVGGDKFLTVRYTNKAKGFHRGRLFAPQNLARRSCLLALFNCAADGGGNWRRKSYPDFLRPFCIQKGRPALARAFPMLELEYGTIEHHTILVYRHNDIQHDGENHNDPRGHPGTLRTRLGFPYSIHWSPPPRSEYICYLQCATKARGGREGWLEIGSLSMLYSLSRVLWVVRWPPSKPWYFGTLGIEQLWWFAAQTLSRGFFCI